MIIPSLKNFTNTSSIIVDGKRCLKCQGNIFATYSKILYFSLYLVPIISIAYIFRLSCEHCGSTDSADSNIEGVSLLSKIRSFGIFNLVYYNFTFLLVTSVVVLYFCTVAHSFESLISGQSITHIQFVKNPQEGDFYFFDLKKLDKDIVLKTKTKGRGIAILGVKKIENNLVVFAVLPDRFIDLSTARLKSHKLRGQLLVSGKLFSKSLPSMRLSKSEIETLWNKKNILQIERVHRDKTSNKSAPSIRKSYSHH